MSKNYTQEEYAFLGKQFTEGTYVARSTFILSVILALLIGMAIDRYILPKDGFSLPVAEHAGSGANPVGSSKNTFDSILLHEESVKKDPENAEAWTHLGNLYYDAGKPEQAIAAYEKALSLKPDNTSVLVDCGVMYREKQDYNTALEYFNKALSINPKHEFALFNSGVVLYHDLGRQEEGLALWRKLVQVNPNAKMPQGKLLSDFIKELESGAL